MKSLPNPNVQISRTDLAVTRRAAAIVALVALAVVGVSCSAGGADTPSASSASAETAPSPPATPGQTRSDRAATTAATSTTIGATTTAVATTAATTTAVTTTGMTTTGVTTTIGASARWVRHPSGDECRCADGSDHAFHTRAGDPSKVLLYFQGGGACVDEVTCRSTDGTYKAGTWPEDHPDDSWSGIFAVDEPRNPFNGWTYVYVPYCSADFFLGDTVTDHGSGLTIEHRGANTARRALDHVVEQHGDLEQLVVAGTSAGAVPTPLIAGLASDALPGAEITVLADGAGAYPSDPALNRFLGDVWGTAASIPAWPELESLDVGDFGIPDLFSLAGAHDPSIRMTRFDDSDDLVQAYFIDILVGAAQRYGAGVTPFDGDVLAALDRNEDDIEDDGVPLDVFIAPGGDHTVLDQPRLYELEVDGVALVDWIALLLDGESPGDARCVECTR